MLVIFEGAKGTGKTSAIEATKALLESKGFEVEIAKFDRGVDPTSDMAAFITSNFLNNRPTKENPDGLFRKVFLIDRFHLTEFVHRTFDGQHARDEATTLSDTIFIHRMLMAARASVVILHCEEADRVSRLLNRKGGGDRNSDSENGEEIAKFWDKLGRSMKERYHNISFMNTTELNEVAVARIVYTFVAYSVEQTLRLFL